MELFIPTRIQKDNVFGKGFGVAEMKKTVFTAVIGLLVGATIGLIWFNQSFQTVLIATVITGTIFAGIGYFVFTKNTINLSVYHYITLIKTHLSSQHLYLYKRLEEWT